MSYFDDEKRLLAHAAEATQQLANVDTNARRARRSTCKRAAGIKRALAFAATLAFVVACSFMVLGLSSLAIGTTRPCHDAAVKAPPQAQLEKAKAPAPAVDVDVAAAATATSPFSRLIDAVSPDTLHDLLHEYFPDMYKHGVYPSEKSALEVIHRKNAALATSIAQLARRDLNTTSSAVVPTSSAVSVSSVVTSSAVTSRFVSTTSSTTVSSTSASGTKTTTSHTTLTTAAASSSTKVTSVYTSTINGTPTVVTATSVVGVAATNPTGTSTTTGSLQTGAAVPLLSGANAQLAKAVAGVLVGAMLV